MILNDPEYIPVDELGSVAAKVKVNLALPVLNYQYGYIKELDETLLQWEKNPADAPNRFPLIWVEEPFNVVSGQSAAYYGKIEVLRVFVMNQTEKQLKSEERMTKNFKPIILPIIRDFLKEIDLSIAFHTQGVERIERTTQNRYYWGESQASVLTTPIDCTIVTIRNLMIANNSNCTPASSFGGPVAPVDEP